MQKYIKKWWKWIAALVTTCLMMILLGVSVGNAGPGDFWFFPKLILENRFLTFDSASPDSSIANVNRIVMDRAIHLQSRSNNADCTGVSVAAAELDYQLGRSFALAAELGVTHQADLFVLLHNVLRDLDLSSECELPIEFAEIADLTGVLAAYSGAEDFESEADLLVQMVLSELELALEREAESEVLDQQRLDNINSLVSQIRSDEESQNHFAMAVQKNLALQNINLLLDEESVHIINWDKYSDLLCRYYTEQCLELDLEAKWNSINFANTSVSWAQRLNNGMGLFLEVVERVIPR